MDRTRSDSPEVNRPTADAAVPPCGAEREALDANDLGGDDPDARTDIGLDETFPASDTPATLRPERDGPPPSSGYREDDPAT